ncbi:M23 family metallopeptidase [Nocardioides taihuensis]|uniref:M23 family metallopeptidase n=1 Tax=Nocardioides taihuensis TaxID=1835606 RepID=A0ABW0BFG3_9ACTN
MGDHRAARRAPRRRPSTTAVTPARRAETAAELTAVRATGPGKRKASRREVASKPRLRLPSLPVVAGVAALAIATGGAVSVSPAESATDGGFVRASAMSGASGTASANLLEDRSATVSRDSRRDAAQDAAAADLVAQAEAQAKQRTEALSQFAEQAEKQAAKLKLNAWVLPVDVVQITAEFGEYGLWASYHTGIDFNGEVGDPIYAIAGGTVTSAAYDGSYGNKTVITLDDGTEIWYCHQTSFLVSPGETVAPGEQIGTVGATGHVTGSHLHVEVHPGGGDAVDPREAFLVHGITLPPRS